MTVFKNTGASVHAIIVAEKNWKLYQKPGVQNFYHQQKIKQVKSNESNEIMFRRFGDIMKLLMVIHEKRIGYMNRKLKEYVLLLPNLLLLLKQKFTFTLTSSGNILTTISFIW